MSIALRCWVDRLAARDRAAADRVSPFRQLGEMAYLRLRNRIGVREYTRLGLFRSSIPWPEKKNFAGQAWYLEMIERINPAELRVVAWNKVVTHGLLQTFGIPTPPFYGYISRYNGMSCDGVGLRTADDLARLIARLSLSRACFKLVGGWSGRGFIKAEFDVDASGTVAVHTFPGGSVVPLERFWRDHLDISDETARTARPMTYGYLCQGLVEQHPLLAKLHPESVNTYRIWMYQPQPGRWEMYMALLRMGTGDACVDNGAPGGIGALVDIDSGRLHAAIRRGRKGVGFESFTSHPTTGVLIEGFVVPMWDCVLPLCRRTCSVFPYFRLMALDVAVTADGPLVIEVEADPHSTHQAHFGKGIRSLVASLAKTGAPALR